MDTLNVAEGFDCGAKVRVQQIHSIVCQEIKIHFSFSLVEFAAHLKNNLRSSVLHNHLQERLILLSYFEILETIIDHLSLKIRATFILYNFG